MQKLNVWCRVLGVCLCFLAFPSKAQAPENELVKSPYFVVKGITKIADKAQKLIDKSKQAAQAVGDKTELAEKATIHRMREILQKLTPEELADPKNIALPLQKTSVNVKISGVIAEVSVVQIYKNIGKIPVEGTYIFPASTHSAVYGMTMTIGDRVYEAKIKEREEAQKIYDKAKAEGKKTALLKTDHQEVIEEKASSKEFDLFPKTQYFKMSLANILPDDEVKVELKYIELLVPTDQKYQFFYPMPTLAKYVNQRTPEGGQIPENEHFEMTLNLEAGMKIQAFSCHASAQIAQQNPQHLEVKLNSETSKKQDFRLKYELSGKTIETGILLHQGADENFFLAMIQPPQRIDFEEVPPREYIFVVDVSGSMTGFPLKTTKHLMMNLLQNVRPQDRFNVVLFAGASDIFAKKSVPATPENLKKATQFMSDASSGGSTDLHSALKRLLEMPAPENYARNAVIVTDGAIHFPAETYDFIQKNAHEFNFFPFGIGETMGMISTTTIRSIALASNTLPFIVTADDHPQRKAEQFKNLIQTPILTNLKAEFSGIEIYDLEPAKLSDVFKNKPVLIFGKWRGEPKGNITISGMTNQKITQNIPISVQSISTKSEALKYLWARTRIEHLSIQYRLSSTLEMKQKIIDLGLKYNLLTDFTSFVVADEESMKALANNNVGAVPEPHEWLLIGLLIGLVLFLTFRNYMI